MLPFAPQVLLALSYVSASLKASLISAGPASLSCWIRELSCSRAEAAALREAWSTFGAAIAFCLPPLCPDKLQRSGTTHK